jgi:DNA-binding response OmpR family regulator
MAKKLLLVVDDEKALVHALQTKLAHEGFDTRSAASGEEALKLLREEQFDLLLLDLVMIKVDGFHVLETMRKEDLKTPTIVLTNLGDAEAKKRVLDLGARDFLVKSDTSMSKVVEHIETALTQ